MTGIPSLPSSVLNVEELALLGNKSGATRLGFAVLLKFFQKEVRFPAYKNEVPGVVITYLATQARVPAEAYLQYLNLEH